jgi:alkylated DNA repair dioxygenase AlkB
MASSLQTRRKETLASIRTIFGKLRTYNGTSTRVKRSIEDRKKFKRIEATRYFERIRQYKEIMKAHGWTEAAPTVIPDSLRELTPTSLQLNAVLPEPVDATTRSSFIFTPPEIHRDFITEEESDHIMAAEVKLYAFRAGVLKRAPKMEWFRSNQVRYSWGQHRSNDKYAQIFPDWMEKLADRLPEEVNHAIIIKYHDGMKTYAPWHSDKCEELGRKSGCMKRGSSFFVISVGDPRTFELGDESAVIWSKALPHGSIIKIDAETNMNVKHCVPQDQNWVGCRWSLIFRTIVE